MPETKWTVAGTPPIAEVIGWAKAVEYLTSIGLDRVRDHDERLVSAAAEGLRPIPGVRLYGPKSSQGRTSILSFNIDGVPNEEVGRILTDDFGVSVRAGTHCARGYFMENQTDEEVYGSVRASFYLYNTPDDVARLVKGVRAIAETCAV
jgi:cysteine desulfurase/selenocysteine lyase